MRSSSRAAYPIRRRSVPGRRRPDLRRLADNFGTRVRRLPESIGGQWVDLIDPGGMQVRVVAGVHEQPELDVQRPHTFNFGDDVLRANIAQRPPRVPARVERVGHLVVQSTKYLETLNWYLDNWDDRQRLPVLSGPAQTRPDHELHPLGSGLDTGRSPHSCNCAGPGQPVRAFGVSSQRPRRPGGRRRIPQGAWLSAVLGNRQAHPGQSDLRLLARRRRLAGRTLCRRRHVHNTLEPGWAPFAASGLAQWGPPASRTSSAPTSNRLATN